MNIIKSIINLGIEDTMSTKMVMRAKLLNMTSLFNIIVAVSTAILIFPEVKRLGLEWTTPIGLTFPAFTLYLSYKQRFELEAHIMHIITIISITWLHYLFGNDSTFLPFYLVEAQAVILLFAPNTSRIYLIVLCCSILLIHYINIYIGKPVLTLDGSFFNYINTFTAFFMLTIMGLNLRFEVIKQSEITQNQHKLLQEKKRQLDQFKYIISHDLKEPVRSIVSFANLLKRYKDNPVKRKEFSEYISKSGQQFTRLVENIRDYQELDHLNIRYEDIALQDIIEDVKLSLDLMIKNREVVVELEDTPTFRGVQYPLILVFKNLIENGIRFNTSIQPTIHIWSETIKGNLYIFIKDNGIGIEKSYHKQIFQLFKRLGTDQAKGSGLGLNIAQKILQQMGGNLILYSSEVGKGSIFAITFPASYKVQTVRDYLPKAITSTTSNP